MTTIELHLILDSSVDIPKISAAIFVKFLKSQINERKTKKMFFIYIKNGVRIIEHA